MLIFVEFSGNIFFQVRETVSASLISSQIASFRKNYPSDKFRFVTIIVRNKYGRILFNGPLES